MRYNSLIYYLTIICSLPVGTETQIINRDRFVDLFNIPQRAPVPKVPRKFNELTRNRDFPLIDQKFDGQCENLDQPALIRRLKDEGDYNPSYMAPTIEQAAELFEDLSARRYQPASYGTCDESCKETADKYIETLKSLNKLPPEDEIELNPDLSNTKPRLSNAAMAQYFRNTRMLDQSFGSQNSFFSPYFNRNKRYSGFPSSIPSSMLDEDIGQASAVYCWKAGDQGRDKNKNLHHLCTACRSIKVLSEMHFPRYLNQVDCGGNKCLDGAGVCAKQYIVVKVLRNKGTKNCQRWVKEQIRLSVCCDCMLKRESYLFQRMRASTSN